MTRFEIQDIASQNYDGVTFRALDHSTNQIVSLRRFFPFGQDEEGGEGLDPQEGKAFASACQKLARVEHPALRKTIFGDTDPVDGMPFLVTEWIDGEPLAEVLGNNAMDPGLIIGLVREALDVCITLSKALGNEAVWIDTKLEAIIVSNPEENPTFSFRICPFKWLGTQSHEKDLTGMISLVETLMGWKSKLVSDQAGLGLGGWLKYLRQNPQMGLQDALGSLPDPSSENSAEPIFGSSNKAAAQPFILASANQSLFTKKSIGIMALSACLTGALVFFLYQRNSNKPDVSATVPMDKDASALKQPEAIASLPAAKEKLPTTKLWSPAEIATAAWYDASNAATVLSNGGLVFQWKDSSGNNRHIDQSLSGNRPSYSAKAVSFDGVDDYLSSSKPFMYANGMIDIYFVASVSGQTLDKRFLAEGNSSSLSMLYLPVQTRSTADASMMSAFVRNADNQTLLSNLSALSETGAFDQNTKRIYQSRDTGSRFMTRVNGGAAQEASYTRSGTLDFDTFALGAIPPRAGQQAVSFIQTQVNEIIITPSLLDDEDREKIEGYLAHKWSLAGELPINHPFKSAAPTSSPAEPGKANPQPNPVEPSTASSVLKPQDTEIIKAIKDGEPATIQGIVRSAEFSTTGKSIYIAFSNPDVETEIHVVIHGSDYQGGSFSEEAFAPLLGKAAVFSGTVYREPFNGRPPFVKITDKRQIKWATEQQTPNEPSIAVTSKLATPQPASGDGIPVFSPENLEAFGELELNTPVSLKGVVQSVQIPEKSNMLYVTFTDIPADKQIRVTASPSNFDGNFTREEFKKIEAQLQEIVGKTVIFEGVTGKFSDKEKPHFVKINSRANIKAEAQNPKVMAGAQGVIYSPDDISLIEKLPVKTPVKLRGTLKIAKYNPGSTAIVLYFSAPYKQGQLRGVAYKQNFKDSFDVKSLQPFTEKEILLDGVLINDKSKNPLLIEITSLSQISIAPE